MVNSKQKSVLILALFAGEIMMKSGAEIYRVEDTAERICKACGVDYVECFATPTGIFLSLDSGGEVDMHTFLKRIHDKDINLDRISAVNTFSRVFTTTDLSIEDGFAQLREIRARPVYPFLLRLLAAVLVGAFFCPIYKGGPDDLLAAGAISALSYLMSAGVARLGFPDFIRIFISCAAATGLVLAASVAGLCGSISPVILAATTIFLPGVAITNAARDFLSGDTQSGVARFADAFVAAVGIAGGVAIGIKLWLLGGGELVQTADVLMPFPWFLPFGFLATLGFCLLFNAPVKRLVQTSLIGAAGMLSLAFLSPRIGMVAACFVGTCAIAILAEIASRAGKDATTIFIIPGIIPFVPGASMYQAMHTTLVSDYAGALAAGTQALLAAGCIALALALVASVARLILRLRRLGNAD